MTSTVLKRRALRIDQHPTIPLYVFTLAAEEVHQVADVARISRDEAGKLIGYQRPEKKQHVKQILEYLDGEEVLFPNADHGAASSVRFKSSPGPAAATGCAPRARWRSRYPMPPTPPGPPGSSTVSSAVSPWLAPATPAWL